MTQKLENLMTNSGSTLVSRFVIGGVLGWMIERIYRRTTDFGFLGIPFLPIYGIGCVLSGLCRGKPFSLLVCVILIETIGLAIDPKLWDYSHEKLRIGPACSAKHLLYFLILSLIFEYAWNSRKT